MRFKSKIPLLVNALKLASAAVITAPSLSLAVHETRAEPPLGFVKSGTPSGDVILSLRIRLTSVDVEGLRATLDAVSEPASPRYGQYLSMQSFLRPSAETLALVTNWLDSHNISYNATSSAGNMLRIVLSVDKANTVFGTTFSEFTVVSTGQKTIRTLEYSLPATLIPHISFVHPTTSFPPPISTTYTRANSTVSLGPDAIPATCGFVTTVQCIQAMYGIPAAAAATEQSSLMWITDFGENPIQLEVSDINDFLAVARPGLTISGFALPMTEVSFASTANPLPTLEMEYQMALTGNILTWFWADPGDQTIPGGMEIMADVIQNQIENFPSLFPPTVVLIPVAIEESFLSSAWAIEICNVFMSIGTLGVTVVVSAGDGLTSDAGCTLSGPTFPASCPFVTTVGATVFTEGAEGLTESVASFSMGGESIFFPLPDYQAFAVNEFFNDSAVHLRSYPDVAAVGQNLVTTFSEELQLVSSSAASAAIVASQFLLLNDVLIKMGRPRLGFVNPQLYRNAELFGDITDGIGSDCSNILPEGVGGWDTGSGLGTIRFSLLQEALLDPVVLGPEPQAQVTCLPNLPNLCFDTFVGTGLTLGFALPPPGSAAETAGEMMIFSSFPLPYGYVGVFLGTVGSVQLGETGQATDGKGSPAYATCWWFDSETGEPASKEVAEYTKVGPNGNLVPVGRLRVLVSPLVMGDATQQNLLFRCIECIPLTTYFRSTRVANLSTIFSLSMPVDMDGQEAELPEADTATTPFQLVVSQAQFADYTAMLTAAGF
ncbi:peptidase S8/S53 domain-containing protein [Mycena amicta]|nr:peptidase S8/S53 domain-containing protein [Mycena amicta]